MSLATRINPKKRALDPLDERYQVTWSPPVEHGTIADATSRPDLHEHHFNTTRGRRIFNTYRPELLLRDDAGDVCMDGAEEQLNATVTEATPAGKQVRFTPKHGWYPASPMELGGSPKPSLRHRMKTYGRLPDDYAADSPFRWDTSALIEEEELREQQEAEQKQVDTRKGPFAKLDYTQHYVPAAASPSALGLSGLRKSQRGTNEPLRKSLLSRNTSQYQQLRTFPPTARDQPADISLSVADRPKLTPTRRLTSPPRQLTPPKPSSPAALYTKQTSPQWASSPEAVYPSLSASYYDLPAETPIRLEAQHSEHPRHIGGMTVITTIGNYLTGLINDCWNYIRGKPQPQQIVAVETDTTGRKRRAITAEDAVGINTPSPQVGDVEVMPGLFPQSSPVKEPKMYITQNHHSTPPDSRPGSSEIEEVQQATSCSTGTRQQPSPPEPSRNQTEARAPGEGTVQAPQRGWYTREQRRDDPPYIPPTPQPLTLRSLATRQHKLPTHIYSPEQRKEQDANVDNLITKAKKIALETEEDKAFRKSYRTRKQRIEDARLAKELEAQAKKDAEREAEELRKQAAEEAKRKEAVETAAKARKEQFIRPLTKEWENKIRAAMNAKDTSRPLAQTPGTDTSLSRSDFIGLLPQKDASGEDLRPKSNDGPGKRKPSGWLNDEIVNGWNECIVQSLNDQVGYVKGPSTAPEAAAFNCAWLTTLKNNNYNMKSISGWSRRLGLKGKIQNTKDYKILKTKKIFFPINSGAHWMLMIIDVPNREIQFLDSLGGKSAQYFKIARQWLEMELADAYVPEEWTESKVTSQQQMNFDDCGVFTCINALASAVGRDFQDFGVTRGMDDARRMMGAVLINGGFTGDWEL